MSPSSITPRNLPANVTLTPSHVELLLLRGSIADLVHEVRDMLVTIMDPVPNLWPLKLFVATRSPDGGPHLGELGASAGFPSNVFGFVSPSSGTAPGKLSDLWIRTNGTLVESGEFAGIKRRILEDGGDGMELHRPFEHNIVAASDISASGRMLLSARLDGPTAHEKARKIHRAYAKSAPKRGVNAVSRNG